MSDKRVDLAYAFRPCLMCFVLLLTTQLVAAGQSVTNKAWSVLETGLCDKSTEKRAQAVSQLGLIPGDKRAIDMAERALDDPSPAVRRAALTALGDMNARASLHKIKVLARHADAKTVVTIAAVLKKLGDPEAYDIYYQLLTGKRKSGDSILDGIKDRKGLEKMGVETAIGFAPFGGVGTGAYDYFKQNDSSHANLYVTAVAALADDRDPAAEKALVHASCASKDAVKIAALRALAKRGDPTVVKQIEPEMCSDKATVRYTAAATVVHLLDVRHNRRSER